MSNIKQEDVLDWLSLHLSPSAKCVIPSTDYSDNRGPDMIVKYNDGIVFHVESIAFTYTNRGKNQSDFWKAFAQAISRLNPESQWGLADKVAIALPYAFKKGWISRTVFMEKKYGIR